MPTFIETASFPGGGVESEYVPLSFLSPGFVLVLYILYLCVGAVVFKCGVVRGASASKMSFELESIGYSLFDHFWELFLKCGGWLWA